MLKKSEYIYKKKRWLQESSGLVQTSFLRTGSFLGYRQGVDHWEDIKREEEVLAVSNMLEKQVVC